MTIWREGAKNRGNRRLLQPVCLDSLPLEHETLAEVLRAKGYFTAHIGKWHLGRAEAYPQAHGFNINVGGTLWGAPQSFWYPFNGDAYFRDWRYVPDLEPSAPGDYLTDRLTDEAIELMEYSAEADRPFFINLWYHTVHTPIEGKPEHVKYFDAKAKAGPQKNPHYAAMVHSLDENVGRVLAGLKALGLEKNTLVVFTSDNGGFVNECKLHPDMQVTSNAPLRSGKGSCYEGGVRVPLIFAGGGTLPNEEVPAPVWSCDLMPTILDMVGLGKEIPSGLDGQRIESWQKAPKFSVAPEEKRYEACKKLYEETYGKIVEAVDEAKAERLAELTTPPTGDEILRELKATQDSLQQVQQKLERYSQNNEQL